MEPSQDVIIRQITSNRISQVLRMHRKSHFYFVTHVMAAKYRFSPFPAGNQIRPSLTSYISVSSPQILQQPPPQQFTQTVPYNNGSSAEHNFVNPNNNTNGMNNGGGGGGDHKPNMHNITVKVPSAKNAAERDREDALNQQILQNVNQSWQTLASANPTSATVDYSSHILSATLPISIQHFLKYSETIKKENGSPITHSTGSPSTTTTTLLASIPEGNGTGIGSEVPTTTSTGKKKKKKSQKTPKVRAVREKKPRPKPGEIRETKALDGSTLFCCPECQMAYPDRSLIEQHVISHAVERRFVCDICNAALKRKDHLTRHKLSHIPDRPHVCNVSCSAGEGNERQSQLFVFLFHRSA